MTRAQGHKGTRAQGEPLLVALQRQEANANGLAIDQRGYRGGFNFSWSGGG